MTETMDNAAIVVAKSAIVVEEAAIVVASATLAVEAAVEIATIIKEQNNENNN